MAKISRTARIAALCIVTPLCFAFPAHAAEGWDWIVAPYGWAASVGTDMDTRIPPSSASSDTSFNDILDDLDGAFQIHIEGQGDRFGAFADFTYVALSDSNAFPRFHTESDLDTRLFEFAAVWSPGGEPFQGADVFAGLRYLDVDLTLELTPTNPVFGPVTVDSSGTFYDFMLGARYTWALSERWGLMLRGDGSFGDTEGTWNAMAVVNYRTYRHLDAEIDTENANTNITMSGPAVGYGFRF
jgi:hypothetical protein